MPQDLAVVCVWQVSETQGGLFGEKVISEAGIRDSELQWREQEFGDGVSQVAQDRYENPASA